MKKFWSTLIISMVIAFPIFAQLTPSDSTITGTITGNPVLNKNKVYLLKGFVYVDSLASITIPAGTLVLGEKSTQGSLIIKRGGKIFANGTAQEPVIFTSQQPAGLRARGDWGGVVICGAAPNNQGNFLVEGNIAVYAGGNNAHDNSGVMRYCRIEFPGIAYTPNNEINGLTLAAVGDATVIEHIQVSYSGDDSYEWFGGTVNCKWLIAYKGLDDDFDTDFGYSGKVQFAFSYRDPEIADVSKSESFESDNDGSGSLNIPRTSVVFSNMTCIGPKRHSTDVSGSDFNDLFYYGVQIRRSSRMNLFNSVITGFDEGGIIFDGSTVLADTANFQFKNNTWAGNTNWVGVTSGSVTPYVNYLTSRGNVSLPEPNDVLFKAPFNSTSPVLIPQAGSQLLGTASFTDSKLQDPFFTAVTYRGAFSGDGNQRWDIGWANYDPQGIIYRNPDLVWSSIINLTDPNNFTVSVVIGRGVGATDGIDASFGEANLPPMPPSGVDLRLAVTGGTVSTDIRSSATTSSVITYTLQMQNAKTLNWDPNQLGAGKFTLHDPLGVIADLDMKSASSLDVTSHASMQILVDTKFNSTLVVGNQWNLISFPGIHPNSMSVDTLYRGRDLVTPVYQYTTSGYIPVTTLVPGQGYWMYHNGIKTYTWNGTVQSGVLYPKLNYAAKNNISLPSGWSIIGGYDYPADINFLRTMPEGKRSGLVFKYIPGGGYSSVGTLDPGLGHWVELSGAATLYVPGPFSGTLGKNPADELIKSDWGKIFITDAQGQHYTLYVANTPTDLKMFNLPPLPPAGLFDVRFGSQRFVEDLSNQQTIDMTGIVYPVKISVEGLNLKLEDVLNGSVIKTLVKDGSSYTITNENVNVLKITSEQVVPTEYSLEQNYPNPFNPSTTIKFSIPEAGFVRLTIYNALGQKVTELVNSNLDAGKHSYNWDASGVASGLYFYELNTNNFNSVKKMMLMK